MPIKKTPKIPNTKDSKHQKNKQMNEKLLKNINTYKDQNIHFQAQKNLLINIKKFPNIEMIKYDNIFNDKNAQDDQNTYIFTKKCKKKYKEKLLKYKNF